ncbi:MAG: hypothetical protein R3302_09165, partial [Sulfurimonadaceae bacterium]|nr:hypothetical protein [Sulfurimonadaceae bacterium]
DSIAFESKRVNRGNLYITHDSDTIAEAVANGAYGIVCDRDFEITDPEIAWIRVDSVDNALLRLLRFRLIEKEPEVYRCDPITLKLAMQITTTGSFIVLNGSVREVFKQLWECEKHVKILFSPSITDEDLFTSIHELPKTAAEKISIIEQTLFETSFIYENHFYERQLLSPFFIPYLERLLHFFKSKKIGFRLRQFTPIAHFEAIFTNSNLEQKEFGASDKVLIFEPSFELIDAQIDFLKSQANWAKIVYVVPEERREALAEESNIFTYNTKRDIIEILKNGTFHFALIAGQDKTLLEEAKATVEPVQLTLF